MIGFRIEICCEDPKGPVQKMRSGTYLDIL